MPAIDKPDHISRWLDTTRPNQPAIGRGCSWPVLGLAHLQPHASVPGSILDGGRHVFSKAEEEQSGRGSTCASAFRGVSVS